MMGSIWTLKFFMDAKQLSIELTEYRTTQEMPLNE